MTTTKTVILVTVTWIFFCLTLIFFEVEQLTAAEISEMLMFGLSQLGETTGGEEKLNDTEMIKLIGESTNGRWDPAVKLVKIEI